MTTPHPAVSDDQIYGSDRLVLILTQIMESHAAVGDDFATSRAAVLANLRTLQSALPAAIAEVEAAMESKTANP